MMKPITVLLFLLLISHTAWASPNSASIFVSGTVTDKISNETIAGVEVRVKGTDIVTYTNFDGNFFLPELPAGTYTLEFNYITYSSTTVVANGTETDSRLNVELVQR